MRRKALILLTGLLSVCACDRQEPVYPSPSPAGPDSPEQEWQWPEGSTLVGTVTSGGRALRDVVVSDGYLVTKTDSLGRWSLYSEKRHGYVFLSIPSGYEVPSEGVLPQFYAYVGSSDRDTVDFVLTPADQSRFSVYLLGDEHLADKRRDLVQFEDFAKDLNATRQGRSGFALTLGDMSWDAYWSGFDLEDYLALMNRKFGGLQIFHTIGNHDHELGKAGDWDTAVRYKEVLGPTYYSFNAGGVHFVVLDDILCRNTLDGTRSSWNEVDDDQMVWLRKDLSYVPKDTPVVVAMHAPLYSSSGGFYLYNGLNLVKCFSDFQEVYFFTGHTHVCYNTDYQGRSGYVPVFESNCGAVCGCWWYTVYDFPNEKVHICSDGAPGGYKVLEVEDGSLSWYYKGTGRDASYQFRTYDRNSICLSADKYVPDATSANRKGYEALVADYLKPSSENIVILNVWDYDPKWTISVTEQGRELSVRQLEDRRDPLFLSSFEAYSFNHGYTTEYTSGVLSSYYPSSVTRHLFEVRASSPSSTLEIKVTDRFGRTFTESMSRPKPFRLEY